jgi:hypothetical protein
MAGGSAAGATAGGLNTAVYGGSYTRNIMIGASAGAFAGAVFGSIGAYYEGAWSLERVAAQTAASAGIGKVSGGDIVQAGIIGLATSMSAYIYYAGQNENPNTKPGENLVFKNDGDISHSANQNVGIGVESPDIKVRFYHEHSPFMQFISKFPFMGSTGTFHDNWVPKYSLPQPVWDYFFKFTPGHIIAYSMTLSAHYAALNPGYFGGFR